MSQSKDSSILSRTTVINRSNTRQSLPGFSTNYMNRTYMAPGYSSGTYQNISSSGVASVRDSRQKEKQQMQTLNDRFASYIEKVRLLEVQNKVLQEQVNQLSNRPPFDLEPIEKLYKNELEQARKVIDDMAKDRAGLDAKLAANQDEIDRLTDLVRLHEKHKLDYDSKINKLCEQIGAYEAELGVMRPKISYLEDDNSKLRDFLKKYQEDIRTLRGDLEAETCAHIEAENRAQTLQEQLDFQIRLCELIPKDQSVINLQSFDVEKYMKSQIGDITKEMRLEYEQIVAVMTEEHQMRMDAQMRQMQSGALKENLENAHIREEVKKLKSQLSESNGQLQAAQARIRELEYELANQMRELAAKTQELDELQLKYSEDMERMGRELECCLAEIQQIMDAKLSLELEIGCYKKLLEGEENRAGLKQVIEQAIGMQGDTSSKLQEFISGGQSSMFSEASGKMTQSRTSRGNISFVQAAMDGSCIEIENNTSGIKSKVQDMDGWTMKRSQAGKPDIIYNFRNLQLDPGQKLRLYSANDAPAPGQNVGCKYVVCKEISTFGSGSGTTVLMDDKNTEKASLKSTIASLR